MNTFDAAKRHTCSLCRKSYGRMNDLMRHEQKAHPESEEDEDEDSDETENEDSEVEEAEEVESDSTDSEISSNDLEDNPAYQEWYRQARQATREERVDKYEIYIKQGMDEEDAKEKAHVKNLWAVKSIFFDHYVAFLSINIRLKDNETHQDIMEELEEKMEEGTNIDKALKRIVAKHRSKFDSLFEYDHRDEDEGESEEEMEGGA